MENSLKPTSKYEDMFCLGSIVQWWDSLPSNLRQDIEGSGGEPGCIAKARRLFDHYAEALTATQEKSNGQD